MKSEKLPGQTSNLEEKESRRLLIDLTRDAIKSIIQDPVLETVQRGELSPEEWLAFAEQRYLAALPFEKLLQSGMEKAREAGDMVLAETLEKNLQDELGIVDGEVDQARSHETWRRDFYHALGLDEERLKTAKPRAGTKDYVKVLEDLVLHGHVLSIAGALLVLEGSIPGEFKKMKDGRDKTFSEVFVDQTVDSREVREQKAKSRLYLDDHITHDATSHYPDLLKALEKHAKDPEALRAIQQGVDRIVVAKGSFYRSLDTHGSDESL